MAGADSIVPALNEQNGFLGFVVLVDREHDKSIGYSMWASEAVFRDAAAGEAHHFAPQLAERPYPRSSP